MIHFHLHRLNAVDTVSPKSCNTFHSGKVKPGIPFGMECIDGNILHKGCKTFIKPKVIPPLHSDQITKPLMREFMSNNRGDIMFTCNASGSWIGKKGNFAVRNEAPVFHRTR
ncbi:hypothetical protein D9M68_742520 [compost metagenome]